MYYGWEVVANNSGTSPNDDCITMWGCFKYLMSYGLRAGGGIGDIFGLDLGTFEWSAVTFFFGITVVLLNIIFGIIIDTFSSLRAQKLYNYREMSENCFICGISKQTFDRAANSPTGFQMHIKKDHNMWAYFNFIVFVWEQDKDDDDGLEYFVRHKIEDNEITWFPMGKAMRLDAAMTETEVMQIELFEEIDRSESLLEERIHQMQTDIYGVLEQISQAIKADSTGTTFKAGISRFLRDAVRQQDSVVSVTVEEVERTVAIEAARESAPSGALLINNTNNEKFRVFIVINEISQVKLPPDELEKFSLRIKCGENMHIVPCIDINEMSMKFGSNSFILCDDGATNDPRTCEIQIMQGSEKSLTRLVAVVEVSIGELLEKESGTCYVRPIEFSQDSKGEEKLKGVLTFISTYSSDTGIMAGLAAYMNSSLGKVDSPKQSIANRKKAAKADKDSDEDSD